MSQINKNAVIGIAGTVGVGKSTLTRALADRLGMKVSLENVDNNPYLNKYYDDFERWGFHLQVFFLMNRFKEQRKIFEYGGGYVQDRTIYEDMEIFARLNYENNTMTEEDYLTYKGLFDNMVMTPFFQKPDIVIYLEGELDHILDRINERARDMEVNTDNKYWNDLYYRYEKWIEEYNHTPVLRLNIKEYDVNDPQSIDMIVEKLSNILQKVNK